MKVRIRILKYKQYKSLMTIRLLPALNKRLILCIRDDFLGWI